MVGPTTDHDQIRQWAQRHSAQPAQVKPFTFDSEPAILHFIFGDAGKNAEQLKLISWDAFFMQFALMGLSMVFDESPTFELLQTEKVSLYHRAPGDLR